MANGNGNGNGNGGTPKPPDKKPTAQKDPKPVDVEGMKHLAEVKRHKDLVISSADVLSQRLWEQGRVEFARNLMALAYAHDVSKFQGIEWRELRRSKTKSDDEEDKKTAFIAFRHHQEANPHHPEHWGGVNNMPEIHIAEMVCDMHARSSEIGTDLRGYVKTVFLKKHNITTRGKPYRKMKEFIDLLLDPPLAKME